MTIKMKYGYEIFKETIEIDYSINMVCITQEDIERKRLDVVTLLGKQTKDLYELLKEMYE